MPVYYEADISGDGQAALSGGNAVIYVAFRNDVIGNEARQIEATASDHLLRLGWFSLARQVTIQSVTDWYWMEPIYFNFRHQRWQPSPNGSAGGVLTMTAERVRWHLSDGATGRLVVFGA